MLDHSPSTKLTMPEAELIDLLRKNNSHAFETLVRCYSPKMFAIARRFFAEQDDAQECLQQSFVQVFEKIHTFKQASTLATWLHRITVNTALMMIRKNNRHPTFSIDDFSQHYNEFGERTVFADNKGNNIEFIFEQKEMTGDLTKIIHALPEKYCNVILLRDIQELSTRETAEILMISEASVKTQLHRARLFLKACIEQIETRENNKNFSLNRGKMSC